MLRENSVKYIGFYDSSAYIEENRNSFLSATNKMDYIADSIVRAGYKVQIISPSWTANNKGYYCGRTNYIANDVTLTCGPTFGANNDC
jgi:hypothetical protein